MPSFQQIAILAPPLLMQVVAGHPYSAVWKAGRSSPRELRKALSSIQSTPTLYPANSSSYIVTKVFYGDGCDNPYYLLAMLLDNCFIETNEGYYFKINYYEINATAGYENVTYFNSPQCTIPYEYEIRPTGSCFLSEMNTGNYLDDFYSPVVPTLPQESGWVERIYGTSQQCSTGDVNPAHIAWFPTDYCYDNEDYSCFESSGVVQNIYSNSNCNGIPMSTVMGPIETCERLASATNSSEACYTVLNCTYAATPTSAPSSSPSYFGLSKGGIFGIIAAGAIVLLFALVATYKFTTCCGTKSAGVIMSPRGSMYGEGSLSTPFVDTEMRPSMAK